MILKRILIPEIKNAMVIYDYTIFPGLAMLFCEPAGILSQLAMDSSKQWIDDVQQGHSLVFKKNRRFFI